jgi:hypothetical protein
VIDCHDLQGFKIGVSLEMRAYLVVCMLCTFATAGPIAFGVCQTACNAGAVLCYSAARLTFGAAGPPGWAAAACSAAQGVCMAACVPLLLVPTP